MKNLRLKAARAALVCRRLNLRNVLMCRDRLLLRLKKGTITLRLNCALLFAMNWGKHSTNCFGNGKPL